MIRMAGMDRLVGSPIYHALGTSSPFYYASSPHGEISHTSVLTPYDSARLYLVWRGRTDMDVSRLWDNIEGYEKIMRVGRQMAHCLQVRAIWLRLELKQSMGQEINLINLLKLL